MDAEERAKFLKNEVAGLQRVRPNDWRTLFERLALNEVRQAEAAARAEEQFDCWEEAVGMTEILSFPELVKWIREQFEEAAKTQL